ncbi:MAG: DUF3108 domain-containing protein [Arenicellales bacterium]|nr:DUF3108 domain-containing protein [Arenicellales bacterium]
MNRLGRAIAWWAILAAGLLAGNRAASAVGPASSATLLVPFSTTYQVSYSGLPAQRTVVLDRQADHYALTAVTRLTGVAALVGFGPVTERSQFEVHDGVIRPLLYTAGEEQANPDHDIRIEFDWSADISRGFAKGADYSFPIEAGVQDPLSFELMARLDIAGGNREPIYTVHEGYQLRPYRFLEQGPDTLRIKGQHIDTVRYLIDRQSRRQLYYWLAPTADYLAVQLRQVQKGKVKSTVLLLHSSLWP